MKNFVRMFIVSMCCVCVVATLGAAPTAAATSPSNSAPITMTKAGSGQGAILVDGKVVCDVDCARTQITQPVGQAITVDPQPARGSVFAGWQRNGAAAVGTITVQPGDMVTAVFELAAEQGAAKQSAARSAAQAAPPGGVLVSLLARGTDNTVGDTANQESLWYVRADHSSSSHTLRADREFVGDLDGPYGSWETFWQVPVNGIYETFKLKATDYQGQTGLYACLRDRTLYASCNANDATIFESTETARGANWKKMTFKPQGTSFKIYAGLPSGSLGINTTNPPDSLTRTSQFWLQWSLEPLQQNAPLFIHQYAADPSAHVFNGRIYIYPSHDPDYDVGLGSGSQSFEMVDYHVYSMDNLNSHIQDHGQVLHLNNVPWASARMWAPDVAQRKNKEGKAAYYLFFPAKSKAAQDGEKSKFRIGRAYNSNPSTPGNPAGPFTPNYSWIRNSFSVDPGVLEDDEDPNNDAANYYMYFGGIGEGEYQCWRPTYSGNVVTQWTFSEDLPSPVTCDRGDPTASNQYLVSGPVVARLAYNMADFENGANGKGAIPQPVVIYRPGTTTPLNGAARNPGDQDYEMRYFEAPYVNKINGKYFLSYSTGWSGNIWLAVGTSPYGPFTALSEAQGGLLQHTTSGWTIHHSILPYNGKYYFFYHNAELAGGQLDKRTLMFKELNANIFNQFK